MSKRSLVTILVLARLLEPVGAVVYAQRTGTPAYIPLPTPVVTIGAEGDPDYEFATIGAALHLPTGNIAVADWRTPGIRVYDSNGRLIRTLGRRGAGPGEFRAVYDLFLAGDTLIAYDWHLRRLTRFLASGVLVSVQSVQPAAEDGPVDLVGRLPGGRWLVTTPHSPSWTHGHGVYRDTLRVGTIRPSSTGPVRWVGAFPGLSIFAYMPGQDKTQWVVGPLAVAATGLAAALGDTVVVGDTGVPELRYFLADGRPLGRIPIAVEAPSGLRPQLKAARDEALAQTAGQVNQAYIQAQYEASRQIPRYRDFTVASDHRLWIRLFEERPTDSTHYLVVDAAGGVRARVSLPPRSRVLSVHAPWVLVALRNADDVEQVGAIRWVTP